MLNNEVIESIKITSSITNKTENQDYYGEFECRNFRSIFIADGLGSYKYAKLSSEIVINSVIASLNEFNDSDTVIEKINFQTIFRRAKQDLIRYANNNLTTEEGIENNLFATTLITVIETNNKIKVAYTGNGAAWHIRGNFNSFPDSYFAPWCAINLINPHTIPEKGKEALYKLISDSEDFRECNPSIIEIEKDSEFGDIIMVCTDGIYSADQLKFGKNDKGVWIKYEPQMMKFFEYLNHFFKNNTRYDKESLKQTLNQYLEDVKPWLEDDATIGIIFTKEFLSYQTSLKVPQHENSPHHQV